MKRPIASNPVTIAVVRSQLQRSSTTIRVQLLMTESGEDAADLLSELACLIGAVCIGGSEQFGRTPWVRQLHGALCTIQDMCLVDNYCWNKTYALALDKATAIAIEHLLSIKPQHLASGMADAQWLAHQIKTKTLAPDSINRNRPKETA